MKKGIFAIVILLIVSIYFYTNDEPKKVITVTMEKNETVPIKSEENNTIVKQLKVKEPIVSKTVESDEQNETNETIVPKMCLVGVEKKYFSFESYTFDEFGHVKTVTTDRNKDGKPETKTFLSYDERGNLIKSFTERYQDKNYQDIPAKVIGTTTMSYDEDNHLIDKIKENNSFISQWHYGYDEQGNVNYKVLSWDDKLKYEVQVINRYDKENHLLSIKYKFIQLDPKLIFTNGEFSQYEYQYNKKGQLIKKIDPSYYRVFEYHYDELGHLVKEESYRNRINQPNKIIRHLDSIYYKYDKYGNLIEKSNSNGEILLKQRFEVCK